MAATPLTEAISNIADNTTKKVEFINTNRKGTKDDMVMGLDVGLTHVVGLRKTGLALEPPLSHSNNVG